MMNKTFIGIKSKNLTDRLTKLVKSKRPKLYETVVKWRESMHGSSGWVA